jgi:predicted DCC family thiol-disulfide oxidoreductase YuxK
LSSEGRWIVLYDGDCGICKWLLAGLLRRDRARRLRSVALQAPEATELLADLTPKERMESWHLISPDGERLSGGAAIPPLLGLLPGGRPFATCVARFPRATDHGYRWVARNRSRLSRLVPERRKRRAGERICERERRDSNPRPPA